jgi:hypothetical protein
VPDCAVANRAGPIVRITRRVVAGVVALVLVPLGMFSAATTSYRAVAWDSFTGTVTHCRDLDLRSPDCVAAITEKGRTEEVAIGSMGSPVRLGEERDLWVAPDRRHAIEAGWMTLALGPLFLVVGLISGAVAFFPRTLRRSRLLWGVHAEERPAGDDARRRTAGF